MNRVRKQYLRAVVQCLLLFSYQSAGKSSELLRLDGRLKMMIPRNDMSK